MNRLLLDILYERNKLATSDEDKHILEFFVEYLDHGSLWLFEVQHTPEPVFIFTNEAQRYRFTIDEIRTYYKQMKSGIALDWETIPFEYITKN